MRAKNVIVCDIGASSARVFNAAYDGSKLSLDTIHRFTNKPISVGPSLYWDIFALYEGIKKGIAAVGNQAVSIGIDAMSNDYLLIDKTGAITEPPHATGMRVLWACSRRWTNSSQKKIYITVPACSLTA